MCVTVYLSHAHVSSKILRQLAIFKTSVFSAPKSTSGYRISNDKSAWLTTSSLITSYAIK